LNIAQKPIAACRGKRLKLRDQSTAVFAAHKQMSLGMHSNQLEDSPPWYLPTCHRTYAQHLNRWGPAEGVNPLGPLEIL
jgi:hypothetical protein